VCLFQLDGAEGVTEHVTTTKEEIFWYSLDKNAVYYLELKSIYAGSYTFTLAVEADEADDFAEATKITVGEQYSTSKNFKKAKRQKCIDAGK